MVSSAAHRGRVTMISSCIQGFDQCRPTEPHPQKGLILGHYCSTFAILKFLIIYEFEVVSKYCETIGKRDSSLSPESLFPSSSSVIGLPSQNVPSPHRLVTHCADCGWSDLRSYDSPYGHHWGGSLLLAPQQVSVPKPCPSTPTPSPTPSHTHPAH